MALMHFIRRILGRKSPYGFTGSYKSWKESAAASTGYDYAAILEKVSASALLVKEGHAAYERDSIAFKEKTYAWSVLGPLLYMAKELNRALSILDFGGSLGSTYMQHKDALSGIKVSWNVVEQPKFVERGRQLFQDETLKFFGSVDEAMTKAAPRPEIFLALSSLQYLEDPYAFMHDIAARGFSYILIDRTPCMKDTERITVQKVPARIYGADTSYPAWILDETKLLAAIGVGYEQISTWNEKFGDVTLRGWLLRKHSKTT